jgi:acid stress chaperone HdeB
MRLFTALGVAGALAFTLSAQAETMDLSTIKCGDFVKGDKEQIGYIAMWLHGYYTGKNDDSPVIDFDKFVKDAGKLGEFCGKNPTIGLITAAEKTLNN